MIWYSQAWKFWNKTSSNLGLIYGVKLIGILSPLFKQSNMSTVQIIFRVKMPFITDTKMISWVKRFNPSSWILYRPAKCFFVFVFLRKQNFFFYIFIQYNNYSIQTHSLQENEDGKRPSWPFMPLIPHHLVRFWITRPSCPSPLPSSHLALVLHAVSASGLRGRRGWWEVLVLCCPRSERECRPLAPSVASRSVSQVSPRNRWMAGQ